MVSLPNKLLRAAATVTTLTALCAATVAFAVEGVGTVDASSLRMRSAASNASGVVDVLAEDQEVLVLSEADGWYKVLHNGTEGYLAAEHVVVDEELGNGKVNVDKLTVRTGPAVTYASAGTLSKGTVVEITGSEGEWFTVSWNGIEGYVNARDLTLTDEAISAPPAPEPSTQEKLAATAKQYLGCRYSYGSSGPNKFDCSGFTMYVFKQYGISLPHSASGQRATGTAVSKSNLQVGDLVFFLGTTHVGIYLGNGQFIHASTTNYDVTINSLNSGYWANHYSGACRVF